VYGEKYVDIREMNGRKSWSKRLDSNYIRIMEETLVNTSSSRVGGSSVGIATRYGLDSQGSIPASGIFSFSTASRPNLVPTHLAGFKTAGA
jgi:hypothetical protein